MRGLVSCTLVSAWLLKACTIKGAGVGGIGRAFFLAYVTYVMLHLQTVERVLIWRADVGQLAELAIKVT